MKLHLFAHNTKNLVKKGDKVKAYKTPVGTIGTANGSYYAHLHHSISEGLTVAQLHAYIMGWSKDKVKKYYFEPKCNYTKMFGRKMDVGKAGWGWLDNIGGGFHPGLDINGLGGGNSDIGYEYTADCDGTVIYVSETKAKDGWGKMVVVEENAPVAVKKPEVVSNVVEKPKEAQNEPQSVTEEVIINTKPMEQKADSFDPVTLRKIGTGALIAVSGALLTYLSETISGMSFGAYTAIVVAVMSVVVNALREYMKGVE